MMVFSPGHAAAVDEAELNAIIPDVGDRTGDPETFVLRVMGENEILPPVFDSASMDENCAFKIVRRVIPSLVLLKRPF
jgi:hypothetical protein